MITTFTQYYIDIGIFLLPNIRIAVDPKIPVLVGLIGEKMTRCLHRQPSRTQLAFRFTLKKIHRPIGGVSFAEWVYNTHTIKNTVTSAIMNQQRNVSSMKKMFLNEHLMKFKASLIVTDGDNLNTKSSKRKQPIKKLPGDSFNARGSSTTLSAAFRSRLMIIY